MQRYDRQVRLWSDSGQSSLAAAHVFAVGRSLAMLECLKNLALAGVECMTLNVPAASGTCFFDTEDAPLAQQLKQMNPKLRVNPENCVVDLVVIVKGAKVPKDLAQKPRLVLESQLLDGSVELQLAHPLPVLHVHPPSGLVDLRFQPWEAYQEFCDSFDLKRLDEPEFRHIPYSVLLVKALQSVGGDASLVGNELLKMQRYGDEENFRQALNNIYKLSSPTVPSGIQELINYASTSDNIPQGSHFWKCVCGLGQFVAAHGALPVSGEIPDMISDSKSYTRLKTVYKEKAEQDSAEFSEMLGNLVPSDYVDEFCRNCRYVQAIVPEHVGDGREETADSPEETIAIQGELPPVAALIGGLASQEATKVLTSHYRPIAGRFVFDGSTQETHLEQTLTVLNN